MSNRYGPDTRARSFRHLTPAASITFLRASEVFRIRQWRRMRVVAYGRFLCGSLVHRPAHGIHPERDAQVRDVRFHVAQGFVLGLGAFERRPAGARSIVRAVVVLLEGDLMMRHQTSLIWPTPPR